MSRPSSSRAAELLALRAQYVAPVNAANLIAALRKSSKRDLTTRVKAINELKDTLSSESDSAVVSLFLEHFVPVYVKAALFDCDWRVRAGFNDALALIAAVVGREIAPWLKTLLSTWIPCLFDPSREASCAALKALETAFPDKEKRQKAVFSFACTEIVDFVSACITATPKTLNSMALYEAESAEDEAERYRVVVSACLGLVEIYMTEFNWSQLKVWEVARTSADFAVQAKALHVLKAAIEKQAAIANAFFASPKKQRLEIVSLAEHEDLPVSNAALSLLIYDVWLDGVSVEGFIAPKLLSLVEKGRLSMSLAKAFDHFGLNERAITKLVPLFVRSDFNPLATSSSSEFYAALLKESRPPREALQLLVDGQIVARGNFIELVAERWSDTLITDLLRGRDVSSIVALTVAIDQDTVTAAVIDELLARDEIYPLANLLNTGNFRISRNSTDKLANKFREHEVRSSLVAGEFGIALLGRGAIDRSEVFSVMTPEALVNFAVEHGGNSLPLFTLDHIDYSNSLAALSSIRDLDKQVSVNDFVGKMLNYPTPAAAEILVKLHPTLDELQMAKTVQLWKKSISEQDEASESLLRVHLDLQTLIPETLRVHLAEDPVPNAAWLASVKEVGLAIDRVHASPNSIECLVLLASVNPQVAVTVFEHRVDVAARALISVIQGQDWYKRSAEMLNLLASLTSRQLLFEVLVEEYLEQGERQHLLAIKELLGRCSDVILNISRRIQDMRLCAVGLLVMSRDCVVDPLVRADMRAAVEEKDTASLSSLDEFMISKLREFMGSEVAELSIRPTSEVLHSDAAVVVGPEIARTWPVEELVKLAHSAAKNERLVLDGELTAMLIDAVKTDASVQVSIALSDRPSIWRDAALFRLLSTEERFGDIKILEQTLANISDVYQYLTVWYYIVGTLDVAEFAMSAIDAGIHAAIAVASESAAGSFDSIFSKFTDLPDIQALASRIVALWIFRFPAIVTRWFESESDRSLKAALEVLLKSGLSQAVIARQLTDSKWESSDGDLKLQFSKSAKQLVANFQKGELRASLLVSFPDSWPLRVAAVELSAIPGASKSKQQFQLLAVRQGLQQSTIPRVLGSWGRAVGRVVEGVEDCYICYSVVHSDFPNSLPSKKCGTCKNAYHKECIYRWFRTSGKTLCPICQSPF